MQNGRGDDYSIIISLPCIKHATKLSGCIDVGSFYFPVKNSGTGSIVENYNNVCRFVFECFHDKQHVQRHEKAF